MKFGQYLNKYLPPKSKVRNRLFCTFHDNVWTLPILSRHYPTWKFLFHDMSSWTTIFLSRLWHFLTSVKGLQTHWESPQKCEFCTIAPRMAQGMLSKWKNTSRAWKRGGLLSAWQRIPPNPNRLSLVDLDFPLHDLVDIDFFMSRLDDFAIFFHVATLKKSIPNLTS